MSESIKSKLPYLAGLLFSTIFGFTFMFTKITLDFVTPLGLIAYRFLFAFITMEILRITHVINIRISKDFRKKLLLVALLQPVLYFLLETYGLRLTTSSEAGMMIALIPVFVTVFGILFLNERPVRGQIIFILLGVAGIIYIQLNKMTSGFNASVLGGILLFLAVITASLFNIASRDAQKKLSSLEVTYAMMALGALVFNMLYVTQLIWQGRISDYVSNLIQHEVILPLLFLGVIASVGAFFLVNFSLSKLPAHVSSVFANFSTVVAIGAGTLILGEPFHLYHAIGGLMIITGVYGTARLNAKKKQRLKNNSDGGD
jgi:drug/metabolite transporter (DMT)-like permease